MIQGSFGDEEQLFFEIYFRVIETNN